MYKNELIAAVAKKTSLPKQDVAAAVNASLVLMMETLAAGEKVQLMGFGTFEIKDRAPRIGRNPRTNEQVSIPASRAVVFKPGEMLKEKV